MGTQQAKTEQALIGQKASRAQGQDQDLDLLTQRMDALIERASFSPTERLMMRGMLDRMNEMNATIVAQEQTIRDLESLSATDPLTLLQNRRGFDAFFEQELARIKRGFSTGAVLVLVDLDKFKQINDTYGHQAGDACLRAVADQLSSFIRTHDIAARLGGDEFAVLLTQTDADKMQSRIALLRAALDAVAFDWQGESLTCGCSIGVAPVEETDTGLADVAARADRDLYAEKKNRAEKVLARE